MKTTVQPRKTTEIPCKGVYIINWIIDLILKRLRYRYHVFHVLSNIFIKILKKALGDKLREIIIKSCSLQDEQQFIIILNYNLYLKQKIYTKCYLKLIHSYLPFETDN